MSDFMIFLEEEGIIQSTEWAFENLNTNQLNALMDDHTDADSRSTRMKNER